MHALARRKHAQFAARPELLACALTGSLARGRVWAGSDLDFIGIQAGPDDAFEDGVEDEIYWEMDVLPLDWLDGLSAEALIHPPGFSAEVFDDSPLEVLWGAQVLFDRHGALTQAVETACQLSRDAEWLRERAANYLAYAQACLDERRTASPRRTILDARRIAVAYGVTAYWMQRGELMSSAIRIPERLSDHPAIHRLFRGIFNLGGQPAWDTFFAAYLTMPSAFREEADPDVFREILPAVGLGMADGGLCHFRLIADGWLPLDEIGPLMGFEPDEESQKARVIGQTRELLEQIARMEAPSG
ncbi:MAG: hypothetical protein U0452_04130 [Anaerolineae bacterium]